MVMVGWVSRARSAGTKLSGILSRQLRIRGSLSGLWPADIMPRPQCTVQIAVTVLHTASLPTASSTGTRSTGIDFPHPRDQPITATCTGSSTVYQTWLQPKHRRCRVIRSDSLPLVHSALISSLPQRGQSIGKLQKYTTTMAP